MDQDKKQPLSTTPPEDNNSPLAGEGKTGSDSLTLEQLQARIKEVEIEQEQLKTNLIRQEHRLIPSFQTLYKVYREKDDESQKQKERRLSALLAVAEILWRRRSAALVVASVGGLVGSAIAIFTLLEFRRQNNTMLEQTNLMQSQNEQIIEQNKLFQDQNRQQLVATNGQMVSALIGDLYAARTELTIHPDSVWEIPEPLVFRILSVSEALVPYNMAEGDSSKLVSRERGDLLQALVSMQIDFPLTPNPTFMDSDLRDANLAGANLAGANLVDAYLMYANLAGANLAGANLVSADLRDADLVSADLRDADLRDADLAGALLDSAFVLSNADFEINLGKEADSLVDFLQYAREHGAIIEDE